MGIVEGHVVGEVVGVVEGDVEGEVVGKVVGIVVGLVLGEVAKSKKTKKYIRKNESRFQLTPLQGEAVSNLINYGCYSAL